jgi:hypothetical protein
MSLTSFSISNGSNLIIIYYTSFSLKTHKFDISNALVLVIESLSFSTCQNQMASVNPRASSLWEDYDSNRSDSEDGDFDRQDPELARRESDGRTPVGFWKVFSEKGIGHSQLKFLYVARQDDRSHRNGELSVDFVVIVRFW